MNQSGKNKRRQFEVEDTVHGVTLLVDSQEEIDFVNYCCEAVQLGAIDSFEYQPDSFTLFEGVKYTNIDGKVRTLFQDHVYSTDFKISFCPSKFPVLAREFKIQQKNANDKSVDVYIDVKGTFNRTARSFSTDRKWVWQKFGIYIYELVPAKFFKIAGCPKLSFMTKKTKKARKMFAGCKSIQQALGIK